MTAEKKHTEPHRKPSPELIRRIADVLKAMGEPLRLQILYYLQQREYRVGDLVAQMDCSQANVSKHLAVLKSAGLIGYRQEGSSHTYYISDPTVITICNFVCDAVERRIAHESDLIPEK